MPSALKHVVERSARTDDIAQILAGEPFVGRIARWQCTSNAKGFFDYSIAVPVRDEEALLPRALDALMSTMRTSFAVGTIVFVVNDTYDGSAALIEARLRDSGQSYTLVEVSFASEIRNAPHARRLALDIAMSLAPDGALLTTDADSYVGADWIATRLAGLAQGYDLICEDVRLDDAELSLLPFQVRAIGDAERSYFEVSDRLWRSWTGGIAGPFAYRASGASLAMRSAAYRAVGGLPTPPSGEDAALCAAMLAGGMTVQTLNDGGTRTSARLEGRAEGGCGACLTTRALENDPTCDAALVPLSILRDRALLARDPGKPSLPVVGAATACALERRPMTYSQILVELDRARSIRTAWHAVNA